MLTRKRFQPPNPTGNPQQDIAALGNAVSEYLRGLEQKNALTLSQAQIYVDQGLQFPATQVASSDVNNLDDYKESNSWTPTLSFGTPGDFSATYSIRVGSHTKVGRRVSIDFGILTSAFTFTTASGNLIISGIPYTALTLTQQQWQGKLIWQGITKAGYTDIAVVVATGGTTLNLVASGSAKAAAFVTAADMPTGGTVLLRGSLSYDTP